MKKYLLISLLVINLTSLAISPDALKKYPYQLLTSDYDILNELNLKRYAEGFNVEPFNGKFNGLDYWQCFPTKIIKIWYEKETIDPYYQAERGVAHLTVNISKTIIHDYVPRRSFSANYARNKVAIWKSIIEKQPYACIGGIYVDVYKKTVNGKEIIEHGWIFENLKTKTGCDSYFSEWCD